MTEITEPIDLREQIVRLCDSFGAKYTNVSEIVLRPASATVTEFLEDENGAKFVNQDTGKPARRTRDFRIHS